MRIESKPAGHRERREWLVLLASFFVAGTALVGLHFLGVQLCLFNKYTGLPCPVCGSSRTVLLLLKGQFADAFILQPLGALSLLSFGLWILVFSSLIFFNRRVLSLTISVRECSYILWIAVVLMAANWAYLLMGGVL